MLKAIFVDLDGTLVETSVANAKCYCDILKEFGVSVSVSAFESRWAGRSWKEFLPVLMPDQDHSLYLEIAGLKKIRYPDYFEHTAVIPGTFNLIAALDSSVKKIVVTSASKVSATAVLEHHDILWRFDGLVSSDDVELVKPAPDPYLKALKSLGFGPSDCLAIEDSIVGIQSAQSAGLVCLKI